MAGFSNGKILGVAICMACTVYAVDKMTLAECREKATAGNAEAQWQMGLRYENGDGVAQNGIRAVFNYKKAAEQKHRKACAKLAELYEHGEYVKRDSVRAARYRALAECGSEEIASAKASAAEKEANGDKVDEIEVALDWILGRNGKKKDPKIGIRMLYDAARSKPIAKAVFVKRWEKGDLDSSLEVLTDEEWKLIVPWFREAYAAGWKQAGLIVGNDERYKKNYLTAARHYEAAGRAGLAKAWYFLGCMYWKGSDKEKWCTPDYFKSDIKARDAFEQVLKIDSKYEEAQWRLGCIYLFSSDEGCFDLRKAFNIFSILYNIDKTNKYYVWWYGLSGYYLVKRRRAEHEKQKPHRGKIDYPIKIKPWQKTFECLEADENHFVRCIRQASEMGCESAQKFIKNDSFAR